MSSCYRNPHRSCANIDSPEEPDDADPEQSDSCPGAGGTLSDSITFQTLGSRPSQRPEAPDDVPPLGISLDADQLKYLKQQQSHREELETETRRTETHASEVTPNTAHLNRATLSATKRQL